MVLNEPTSADSRALDVRGLLLQTQRSLQAAVDVIHSNPDAALDDILAARLLIGTLLLKLEPGDNVEPLRARADLDGHGHT